MFRRFRSRSAGPASDQFSFGAILYEMLSGARAFERRTAVDTLSAIVRDQPVPIDSLQRGVPRPLQQVVDRCLAKDPADRYSDTRQLAIDMRRIKDRFGAHVPEVALTRRRAIWLSTAAALAMATGVAAWRWPRNGGIPSMVVPPFAIGQLRVSMFTVAVKAPAAEGRYSYDVKLRLSETSGKRAATLKHMLFTIPNGDSFAAYLGPQGARVISGGTWDSSSLCGYCDPEVSSRAEISSLSVAVSFTDDDGRTGLVQASAPVTR